MFPQAPEAAQGLSQNWLNHFLWNNWPEKVAIKAMQRNEVDSLLAHESRILLKVHHAHIIRIFQVAISCSFLSDHFCVCVIVCQCVLVRRPTVSCLALITVQIIDTVDTIHIVTEYAALGDLSKHITKSGWLLHSVRLPGSACVCVCGIALSAWDLSTLGSLAIGSSHSPQDGWPSPRLRR